jgi:hypothetical protein
MCQGKLMRMLDLPFSMEIEEGKGQTNSGNV